MPWTNQILAINANNLIYYKLENQKIIDSKHLNIDDILRDFNLSLRFFCYDCFFSEYKTSLNNPQMYNNIWLLGDFI